MRQIINPNSAMAITKVINRRRRVVALLIVAARIRPKAPREKVRQAVRPSAISVTRLSGGERLGLLWETIEKAKMQ